MVFTASLLGVQHKKDSWENKPASLLVVSFGKALNSMPSSLCGRQMATRNESTRDFMWRLVKIGLNSATMPYDIAITIVQTRLAFLNLVRPRQFLVKLIFYVNSRLLCQ